MDLLNSRTANRQVAIFNQTIINNFFPILCLTNLLHSMIVTKIKWKHQICKTYKKSGHTHSDYLKLREATIVVSKLMSRQKDEYQNYIASKLNNLKLMPKLAGLF